MGKVHFFAIFEFSTYFDMMTYYTPEMRFSSNFWEKMSFSGLKYVFVSQNIFGTQFDMLYGSTYASNVFILNKARFTVLADILTIMS